MTNADIILVLTCDVAFINCCMAGSVTWRFVAQPLHDYEANVTSLFQCTILLLFNTLLNFFNASLCGKKSIAAFVQQCHTINIAKIDKCQFCSSFLPTLHHGRTLGTLF